MRPAYDKPLRADAARNRERVLEAARKLFARDGVGAPLDDIAREAGLGPGTLHRHFPTKDALLAAVVVESVERRLDQDEELFALLDGLLDEGMQNRAIKEALEASGFDMRATAGATYKRLDETMAALLADAQRAGSARADLDVAEVKAVLAGALAAQAHVERPAAARIRDLVIGALRA